MILLSKSLERGARDSGPAALRCRASYSPGLQKIPRESYPIRGAGFRLGRAGRKACALNSFLPFGLLPAEFYLRQIKK
jgi:hypothetical protein